MIRTQLTSTTTYISTIINNDSQKQQHQGQ